MEVEQIKSNEISFRLVLNADQSMTTNDLFISKNGMANNLDELTWTQWYLRNFAKHHVNMVLVIAMDFTSMDLFIALI